jgi:outer membrane protein assembly factor BamB
MASPRKRSLRSRFRGDPGRNARLGLLVASAVLAGPAVISAHADGPACSADWPAAWHDAGHLSSVPAACTPINDVTVGALAPKWAAHAGNVITASPVVVGNSVYVGDWNGVFTAYNRTTGAPRWHFKISAANPVYPGLIASSASVVPFADPTAKGGSRLVAVFGGGSTLWALDATTGRKLAALDLDPRDAATKAAEAAAGESHQIEVESSPAVADVSVNGKPERRIYVGMDVHDDSNVGRTGIVALTLTRGATNWSLNPIWKIDGETHETYQGAAGLTANSGTGFGCGGVWSSPAVDVADGLVIFGTANCNNPDEAKAAGVNWSEHMVAARADSGKVVWTFRPDKNLAEAHLDDDFGASPNVFTTSKGRLVGEGRKNGCYYARYAATGAYAWTNCQAAAGHISDGFAIGGFLGTPAVQTDASGRATRIIGAMAVSVPHSAQEAVKATAEVRAMNAATGKTQWVYPLAGPTYSSVAVAGDVALVPDTFTSSLLALDAAHGVLLKALPVVGPPGSAPVVAGDSVFVSAGTSQAGIPGLDKTGFVYRFALPPGLPAVPSG